MHKTSLFLVALAFPLTALAFDYTAHVPYNDVRANSKEAAAVYMLTNLEAVQGYGLGIFGPTRQVNRAEFLKIALGSAPTDITRDMDLRLYPSLQNCFPDVRTQAVHWFSLYVCFAQKQGFVKGNPDGLFHPERTVNYAEALKMLTLIYGYDIGTDTSKGWMQPYYEAASEKGVDLPITITFDTPLTRAQVVRLAAAFRAESEGKLGEYRLAENGIYPDSSSSSSASSVASSAASSVASSSSSMSSSASSQTSLYTLPATSHFLLAGAVSDAIGDGVVRINGETGHIRAIEVKLYQEVLSLDNLKVYTASGVEVMTLTQRTTTDTPDYKQIYQGQLNVGQDFAIPADKDVHLVVRANVRSLGNNGASSQLLQMRTFSVTIQGDTTNSSINQVIPAPFPIHQTSFGHIVSVTPVGPATATLASGSSAVVGAFNFKATPIDGRTLFVENLVFAVSKSDNVQIGQWKLTSSDGSMSIDCTVGNDGVSCQNIPAAMGSIAAQGTTLQLRTNIQVSSAATGAFIQAELPSAGSPTSAGSVQWNDEAGHFRWVEQGVLSGKGTRWQK